MCNFLSFKDNVNSTKHNTKMFYTNCGHFELFLKNG